MESSVISLSLQLYAAIDKNDSLKVVTLISQGVDVNKREGNLTPLMFASVRGLPAIVEILLNAGADVFTVDNSWGLRHFIKPHRVALLMLLGCCWTMGLSLTFNQQPLGTRPSLMLFGVRR